MSLSGGDTLLLVNDVPDQLDLMIRMLRGTDYRILTAASGREAFEAAARARPDLILSDVIMPGISGIELCRMIRADADLRDTPVLLVSAFRKDSDSVVVAFAAGADEYLELPLEPARLAAQVARLLERKRGRDALLESEKKYRSLIEQASDGIVVLDKAGHFLDANSAACDLLGHTCEELVRMNVRDVFPAEDVPGSPLNLEELAAGMTARGESRVRRGDGKIILVDVSTKMLQDGRIQTILRDITDRRRIEQSLREREERAGMLQRLEAIGQLAGGVAHDFNNLLTAIIGFSDLALRRLHKDEPVRAYVEEIRKAADRAAALTRQLLAFGRKQILQPKVLDLNEIVADMGNMLRRLIGEDIELSLVLEPALGNTRADPGQLSQVIVNLAVNARDAMPLGGKLTVETKNVHLDEAYAARHVGVKPGHYVMLAISDTGHGMDAETQKHIFEPFFTTKEGKGTGLGLSTVYGIVKQSGGNVWAYSEVGRGTTFKVYMPRLDAADGDAEAGGKDHPPGRGTETVLLVEDEESVRRLARETLAAEGYQVLEAVGGAEALSAAERHEGRIDLLLTDVVLPQVGGVTLAGQLTRLRPGLRVLFMSGYTNHAISQHGVLAPGAQLLEKPFTPNALMQKVREVLDEPQPGQ